MDRLLEFVANHPVLWAAFGGLLVLLVLNELRQKGTAAVGPQEATLLINHEDAVLLDVRESGEYRNGHLPGAVEAPLGELESRIQRLEKYRDRPIIVYCASGNRSASACARLRKHGFEKVYNLRGGLAAWQRENLPLSRR